MTVLAARGVEVDRCDACAVVWFDGDDGELGALSLSERALLGLSLPERTLRGLVGGVGGAVHETAQVVVPSKLREGRLYRSAVEKSLKFLVQELGGVEGRFEGDAAQLDMARETVGGLLDNASQLMLHVSPVWVLAAVSDVTRGTRVYLDELQSELARQGVVPEGTRAGSVGELLDVLEGVSSRLTDSIETPPLNADDLRASYEAIKAEVPGFDAAEGEATWDALKRIAEREQRSVFEVSTAVALTTRGAVASVSVAADMLYENVFDHYRGALAEIHENGYWQTVSDAAEPYLAAARGQFDAARESTTERLLSGRLLRGLFGRRKS